MRSSNFDIFRTSRYFIKFTARNLMSASIRDWMQESSASALTDHSACPCVLDFPPQRARCPALSSKVVAHLLDFAQSPIHFSTLRSPHRDVHITDGMVLSMGSCPHTAMSVTQSNTQLVGHDEVHCVSVCRQPPMGWR